MAILDTFYGADVTRDWLFRHMHVAADSIDHDKSGPCLVLNVEFACLSLALESLNELFKGVLQLDIERMVKGSGAAKEASLIVHYTSMCLPKTAFARALRVVKIIQRES